MLNAGWTSVSPVEVYVQRACDPSLHEPNYALHLELAEYINSKKANTPRDTAMAIVRLVNHRNPHVSMLALGLLESLVQACGYPFHLQIATKEFLNELVRRFPERPPPFPGPVMTKILETIHGWKNGICVESRWKEDLGNIRDMHRLLTFKGYRFRDMPAQHAIPGASNLKSPDELEADDREAQAAKLQELIRRGTPRDLAAAQELMKIMAGAKPEARPDYRGQTLAELDKLQSKVVLLNEMLDNVDTTRGERFVSGDAYHQVATLLIAARPKIQGWVSQAETDDPESLNAFLRINDLINSSLARYDAFKRGDYSVASNPIPPEISESAPQQRTELIDLLDDAPASTPAAPAGPMDELADLFSSPPPASSLPPASTHDARASIMAAFQAPTPSAIGAIALPGTPKPQTQPGPAFTHAQTDIWGGVPPSGAAQPSRSSTSSAPTTSWGGTTSPKPVASLQQQMSGAHAGPSQQPQQPPKKDPFADLEGLF